MERVWAPWRIDYILGEKSMGCFLCESARTGVSEETLILHMTRHSMIIMNRYPYINGHLMVTPIRHVSSLSDLPQEERNDLHDTLTNCIEVMRDVANPDGLNVGMNLGEAAGAGLRDHIHYHVVPRYVGDSNAVTVFGEIRVIPEDLIATYRRIQPAFEKLED